MAVAHHHNDIADFHIRNIQITPKRSFKVKGHDTLLLKSAMVNIFVHRHTVSTSNRLDDMGHFHFRDLEMTPSRSAEVNFLRILKVRYQLPNSVL